MFSNKKQGSRYQIDQNIAKFMIEFEALAIKTEMSSSQTVDLVFLLSSIFIFILFSVYFPIFLFLE